MKDKYYRNAVVIKKGIVDYIMQEEEEDG